MINEEILKKYGIDNFEGIEKNEDGTFKLDSSLDRIVSHAKDMKSKDPDFIKSIKETAVKESTAITSKKFFKTFRTKFGLEITNSEIDELAPDELAELVHKATSAKSSEDVTKMQQDLIKLANEKENLTATYEDKIKSIQSEYATKEQGRKLNKLIRLQANNKEKNPLLVGEDASILIFKQRLQADGLEIRIDESGKATVYKGESPALNDNQTNLATIEYLADKYWADIRQQSNGGGQGGKIVDKKDSQTIQVSDKFKELENRYNQRRRGSN
jgi:hypothetical protein